MNRIPAVWHRITVGIIGVACLAVGVGAICWRTGVEPVAGWIEEIDPGAPLSFSETNAWPWVLVVIALIAVVWGWRLVTSMIRPGKVDDLILDGSGSSGSLVVAPKLIASAVADDLARHPMFDTVTVRATDDRSRKMIRLVASARPTRSYDEIAGVVGDAVEDIRAAVDGSDLHVQALVHLEQPRH